MSLDGAPRFLGPARGIGFREDDSIVLEARRLDTRSGGCRQRRPPPQNRRRRPRRGEYRVATRRPGLMSLQIGPLPARHAAPPERVFGFPIHESESGSAAAARRNLANSSFHFSDYQRSDFRRPWGKLAPRSARENALRSRKRLGLRKRRGETRKPSVFPVVSQSVPGGRDGCGLKGRRPLSRARSLRKERLCPERVTIVDGVLARSSRGRGPKTTGRTGAESVTAGLPPGNTRSSTSCRVFSR